MEFTGHLRIRKLPEGVYLVTSNDVQGLVVQGKTRRATLQVARKAALQLLGLQAEHASSQKQCDGI